jgi:hypothetical protein
VTKFADFGQQIRRFCHHDAYYRQLHACRLAATSAVEPHAVACYQQHACPPDPLLGVSKGLVASGACFSPGTNKKMLYSALIFGGAPFFR